MSNYRAERISVAPVKLWIVLLFGLIGQASAQEVVLQFFNTPWKEIRDKIPELAEIGYTTVYLPPPFKAGGGTFSYGFDTYDRFDLGEKDQMGTIPTRYGTAGELKALIQTAHTHGIRVHFDNVMNHNGGPTPGYDANTPLNIQPGMVPEDFHLRTIVGSDGNTYYRVQPYGYDTYFLNVFTTSFGLDIAVGTSQNLHFGPKTKDDGEFPNPPHPLYVGVRQPNYPNDPYAPDTTRYYPDLDLPIQVNDGTQTITVHPFANKEPYSDVGLDGNPNTNDFGENNGKFDWSDTNNNGQHDAGEASEPFQDVGVGEGNPNRNNLQWGAGDGKYNMGNPVPEDVGGFLIRAVRWFTDQYKSDGYRLDAVKHVPANFFGDFWSSLAVRDRSIIGYNGNIQMQFNLTRGYSDWNNHRDTVYTNFGPIDDAMLYGEYIGGPNEMGNHFNSGMRMAYNWTLDRFRDRSSGFGSLAGADAPGAFVGPYGPSGEVMFTGNHDNNDISGPMTGKGTYIPLSDRPIAHAFMFTVDGLPIPYTDGYNESPTTPGEKNFTQHGDNAFVGQWGDPHIPNLVYINQHFARGTQHGRWSDSGQAIFERRDKSDNPAMTDGDAVTMLACIRRIGTNSAPLPPFTTTFAEGATLVNYSMHGGRFQVKVQGGTIKNLDGSNFILDPNKYYVFSWSNPEIPAAWNQGVTAWGQPKHNVDMHPIQILQNGQPVTQTVMVRRYDGKDGDPAFNPYGLPDSNTTDRAYFAPVPRVTNGTNLSFIARVDGSAENVLFKLNGGIDLNGTVPPGNTDPGKRDHPPALSNNTYLGYEQGTFIHRVAEKFAAANVIRNTIGSPGSESYEVTIGSPGAVIYNGPTNLNDFTGTAQWVYHNPLANDGPSNALQFQPAPQSAAGQPITLWIKVGYQNQVSKVFVYYTTDGATFPEGSAGVGRANTQVIEATWQSNAPFDGTGIADWWKATLPPQPAGTKIRYKIGAFRTNAPSRFPFSPTDIAIKQRMETQFAIQNFNATTVQYFPHMDYGAMTTGLKEGMNVIRARAFLKRDGAPQGNGKRAPIFNTFTRVFYYDTKRPEGMIRFPATDGTTLTSPNYEFVVQADDTVTEVWYRIQDSLPSNDDSVTGQNNGNGAWVKANERPPTPGLPNSFNREWRFNYINIPSSGTATIQVRLREISSSPNHTLTDVAGHYTTLTRTVNTQGPGYEMYVGWPQNDGDTVFQGYDLKVYFSKMLGNNISKEDLIKCFTLKINGTTQPFYLYDIVYNETPNHHALKFTLPNLYNGNPNFLHEIKVHFFRNGFLPLMAERLVKAQPVSTPLVNFITPPAVNADNTPFVLTLPEKASLQPADREYTVTVETSNTVQNLNIVFQGTGPGTFALDDVETLNTIKKWSFIWSLPMNNNKTVLEGTFTLKANADTDGNTSTIEATATRAVQVRLLQLVAANPNDADDDDDGLLDVDETSPKSLPTTPSASWNNGDVHIHFTYGLTNPLSPDSDGDGLPDALELGFRTPINASATNLSADTNGDGIPNFIADLDPPFYNTTDNIGKVPNVDPAGIDWRRAELRGGTTTDPNSPDTDGDGLQDGIEDANRNGWTDGDGQSLAPNQQPALTRQWPNNKIDTGENWHETAANLGDSDNDGLSDGNGEDKNFNGRTDLFLLYSNNTQKEILLSQTTDGAQHVAGASYRYGGQTSRGINYSALFADYSPAGNGIKQSGGWPKILIKETDPLRADTDGDGLPDGWEVNQGLNALDNGTYNFFSGTAGSPANGATGDPDNDGFTNLQEFINGTNPKSPNTGTPPPPGSIVIGPGATTTVGAAVNDNVFTDWSANDIIALDRFDPLEVSGGLGTNGGDVYFRPWQSDNCERSRDLLAFYARDGGSDGRFYFRVDLLDLRQACIEKGFDLYILIDTGNVNVGEAKLPDNLNVLTKMRWEVAIAVRGPNQGTVFVNKPGSPNTNVLTDNINYSANDVEVRVSQPGSPHATGLQAAYFDYGLDSIEFSISRQALLDAGWNGINPSQLNYQVITTRDGLNTLPLSASNPGGVLDGPNIHDTIRNDWYTEDEAGTTTSPIGIDQYRLNKRLELLQYPLPQWVGVNADNDRGKRIKVIHVVHGNEPLLPASTIQQYINNGAGAGYYRVLDAHQAFNVPFTLHITPTLASAIQWAEVNPNANKPWRDGPAFNQRIKNFVQQGLTKLTGTTFADHPLPYYPLQFTQSSVQLAKEILDGIYGAGATSTKVFWAPERILNANALNLIQQMGFNYTFIDQPTHMRQWVNHLTPLNPFFGFNASIGVDAHRINTFNGVRCLPIVRPFDLIRQTNQDNGLPINQRQYLAGRANEGVWDGQHPQVVTLVSYFDDFRDKLTADAYDVNLRWMANKQWIQFVTADQIADNVIDISVPPDNVPDTWNTVNRGNSTTLPNVSYEWLHYATRENYDHWYNGLQVNGQPVYQGLRDTFLNIRTAVPLPKPYGTLLGTGSGILKDAWDKVLSIPNAATDLARLAGMTLFTANRLAGFHNQTNPNLNFARFSNGSFVFPDNPDNLAAFARVTQSQARFAAVYHRVHTWAISAQNGVYNGAAQASAEDIDLDGENEYLLMNQHIFAYFERMGGRLIASWIRDPQTNQVYQTTGNFLSYSNSEDESEGVANVFNNTPAAHRTSGFKDRWAIQGGNGTTTNINALYNVTPASSGSTAGWTFSTSTIQKTITLGANSKALQATYTLLGGVTQLFVRFGLSPHLSDLLANGQKNLLPVQNTGGIFTLVNDAPSAKVTTSVIYGAGGNNATFNAAANDDDGLFDARPMRNQSLTHQVEVTGGSTFQVALGFDIQPSTFDSDGDGMPDAWETANGLNPNNPNGINGAGGDFDGDGRTNFAEYVLGTSANNSSDAHLPILQITPLGALGNQLQFATLTGRQYRVQFTNSLTANPTWSAASNWMNGTGGVMTWIDNGSTTGSHPNSAPRRFYRLEVQLAP
ncbi:MAG: alpha-amylase family glycosyl hydrolase [Methylacidiphilales bacterium]|nr:alpha-amylase family glycosyl hydrolase [Candidatus Methylacidiphilales bacterium]